MSHPALQPTSTSPPEPEEVRAAYDRIRNMVNRTPVMTCSQLDALAGRQLFFKCENFQKVGAFKFRGACNAISLLSEESRKKGVCTHSSGNHAQALALAAKIHGVPSYIVMPDNAPVIKRNAVEGYGAKVYPCVPTLQAREDTAARVIEETGATFVHPFNNRNVIAGQGTQAIELLEEVPDLDAIIVSVGGGGLISGITIAAQAIKPDIRIIAVEPSGAADAYRSKKNGEWEPSKDPKTICDGLLTSLGTITWPVVRDKVERVVVVDDEATIEAMKLVFERMKIVIEPSAAVAVAAAWSEEFKSLQGIKKAGVILCGGNTDLDKLPWQKPNSL